MEEPEAFSGNVQISEFGGFQLPCFGDETGFAEAENITGGTPPYTFEWSNGSTSNRIENIGQGLYEVKITDANGCQFILPALLRQPFPIVPTISSVVPGCEKPFGEIRFEQIIGGMPPYLISINSEGFPMQQNFDNLPPGDYELMLTDSFGCQTDTMIFFPAIIPIEVELGEEVRLELGDSLSLIHI